MQWSAPMARLRQGPPLGAPVRRLQGTGSTEMSKGGWCSRNFVPETLSHRGGGVLEVARQKHNMTTQNRSAPRSCTRTSKHAHEHERKQASARGTRQPYAREHTHSSTRSREHVNHGRQCWTGGNHRRIQGCTPDPQPGSPKVVAHFHCTVPISNKKGGVAEHCATCITVGK